MREGFEEFLERESRRIAESTLENRKAALSAYGGFLDDRGLEPGDMGQLGFEDYVGHLTSGQGVTERTAYGYLIHVWRLHEYLEKRGDDVDVPDKAAVARAEGLELEETERERHTAKARCSLTPEDMEMMVENAPPPRFKNALVMKLLGGTGMRPRDLRDLTVDDVADDYSKIHVRSSKTHTSRTVPVPDGVRRYLRLWLEAGYRAGCYYAEKSDYLVPGENTEQLGPSTINQAVLKSAEAAGLQEVLYEDANGHERKKITAYSFRYGYANHLKNYVDPERLAKLMGHKDVATTLEFYQDASEEELAESAVFAPDP